MVLLLDGFAFVVFLEVSRTTGLFPPFRVLNDQQRFGVAVDHELVVVVLVFVLQNESSAASVVVKHAAFVGLRVAALEVVVVVVFVVLGAVGVVIVAP